jgi:hypothetical protein
MEVPFCWLVALEGKLRNRRQAKVNPQNDFMSGV